MCMEELRGKDLGEDPLRVPLQKGVELYVTSLSAKPAAATSRPSPNGLLFQYLGH